MCAFFLFVAFRFRDNILVKKCFLAAALAALALLLGGCSYASEPYAPTANFYTVRYFDDDDPARECGYAYFQDGQSAIFHDEASYGSAYDYESLRTAAVGHYYVFDGWYFKNTDGTWGDKANLYNISAEYVAAHGVDLSAGSSASAAGLLRADVSSAEGVSSSEGISSASVGASSGHYAILDKELHVYAHFAERLFALAFEYMDGVDYARDANNEMISQTVRFGDEVGAACPDYSILTASEFETKTGHGLSGHPDYGYVSDFKGWTIQNDFEDLDEDGKADEEYAAAVFTILAPGVKFTGDADHSAVSLPTISEHMAGDLFLDGHIDAATGKRVNELYCLVKGANRSGVAIERWVDIGAMSERKDPVFVWVAAYETMNDDFSLKFFSEELAKGVTEESAAAETAKYRGDAYTITEKFRKKIIIAVSGFGGDVVSSASCCDELDSVTGDPLSPVAIVGFPADLYPDTATIEDIDMGGYYYADGMVLKHYRGSPIVIKRTLDAGSNKVTFLVDSLNGPGYLYSTIG